MSRVDEFFYLKCQHRVSDGRTARRRRGQDELRYALPGPIIRGLISRTIFSPLAVSGMSVTPVYDYINM